MKSLMNKTSTTCPLTCLTASTWQCATNSQSTLIVGYHSLGGWRVLVRRGNSSHRVTFTSRWHYSVGARARWPSYSHNQATDSRSTGPQAGAGLAEWSTGGRSGDKYPMAPGCSWDWSWIKIKKTIIKTPIMGNMTCGDPVCEGPSPERVIRIKSKWSRLIWKKNVVRTPQDLLIRLLIDMRDNTTRINF